MTNPSEEVVEKVARATEPETWARFDRYTFEKRYTTEETAAFKRESKAIQRSFTRARAAITAYVAAIEAAGMRQAAILRWAIEMFGPVANQRSERAMRFVEEALELGQSCGLSADTVLAIAGRVYSRRAGQLDKELGQAGMTLEALAANIGHDLSGLVGDEFNRVREVPKDEWARRHAAKTAIGITADAAPTQKDAP